jgi:hypothetical protein
LLLQDDFDQFLRAEGERVIFVVESDFPAHVADDEAKTSEKPAKVITTTGTFSTRSISTVFNRSIERWKAVYPGCCGQTARVRC